MDKAMFMAQTDLQIGDKVKTTFSGNEEFEVFDIKTIHSLRENTVTFEFKLTAYGDFTPWLQRSEIVFPIASVVQQQKTVSNQGEQVAKESARVPREEIINDYVRRWGNAQQCNSCGFALSYGKDDSLKICCGQKMRPVKD